MLKGCSTGVFLWKVTNAPNASQYVSVAPNLRLIKCLIRDLFVPFIDSLVAQETVMLTKYFEPLQKLRARVWIQ